MLSFLLRRAKPLQQIIGFIIEDSSFGVFQMFILFLWKQKTETLLESHIEEEWAEILQLTKKQ